MRPTTSSAGTPPVRMTSWAPAREATASSSPERTVAMTGVPQSSEQKRTLSRADRQVVTVIGVTQRPQFTLSDAVGQRERVAPQDVDVLVAQR